MLIYLLFFSQSYAPIIGDLLLNLILGSAYYRFNQNHNIYTLVLHFVNAIIWFLLGAVPFLLFKQIWLSVVLWLGIIIGVVSCGFLIMLALIPF